MGRPREIDGGKSEHITMIFLYDNAKKECHLTMKIVYWSIRPLHPIEPIPLHQCEDMLDK